MLAADQQPLRGWVVATPLGLTRILGGFLGGRALQTGQALVLSSPLLLVAYTVGGGTWPSVGWCIATIFAQAVFYQLLGALLYTTIGHHSLIMYLSLRAVLVSGYRRQPRLVSRSESGGRHLRATER